MPHLLYLVSSPAHAEGLIIKSKEGLNMNTVALKWCTPKSTGVGESSALFSQKARDHHRPADATAE